MIPRIRLIIVGLLLAFHGLALAAVPSPDGQSPADSITLAQRFGVFQEALVAVRTPTTKERGDLHGAVAAYRAAGAASRIEALRSYLERHPRSPWRASLLLNMALARAQAGYFTDAIASLEAAAQVPLAAGNAASQALSYRILRERLRLHTRFGHREQLAALLPGVQMSPLMGAGSEAITAAREGLWQMTHQPEAVLRCGIVALDILLRSGDPGAPASEVLASAKAGPEGTDLARLQALAERAGMSARVVHRTSGQPIPVPSVVHWKVGHYAAVLEERGGWYQVIDPAVGGELWLERAALENESSGYFLIPEAVAGPWAQVPAEEAPQILGAGYTGGNEPNATSCDDLTECNDSCSQDPLGLARHRVHSMLVSLNIKDSPLGYTPPKGPAVPVTLTYNQREAYQVANPPFFNLGSKWNLNWLSYVEDDPQNPGNNVRLFLPHGGSRDYSGYDGADGTFSPEQRTGAQLMRVSDSPITYERRMPDGSKYVYAASDANTYYPRRIFLTEKVDMAGNAVTLRYDEEFRLLDVTDALGQVTSFAYEDAGAPLRLTGATDPFGRSARFGYDAAGRLNVITDAIGMRSEFAYDAGIFINAMTTPYGTTTFAYSESGTTRWIEITDPLGETERVEYRQGAPGIPFSDSPVPQGMDLINNQYINGRNTFYWNKEAMKRAAGDYTQARIRHWFHLASNTRLTTGVLESVKNPLENRVWYNYPGQTHGGLNGTLDKPSIIGRALPDGHTQLRRKSYNRFGKLTREIDPEGRESLFEYAANDIDLIRIKRKSTTGYEVLAEYTYNDQHRVLTHTGPAGQVTGFTYNGAGQLTSQTNALGHTTSYEYDPDGYLLAVIDANGNTQVRYTYDAYGRIRSQTDAAGYTLTYDYDALNRRLRTTYPDGTFEKTTWDKLDIAARKDRYGNLTRYTYDAVGNRLSETDPDENTTAYEHYANGRLFAVIDPAGNRTEIERDIQGREIARIRPDGSQSAYRYDSSGRRDRITDALGGHTDYAYGLDDRLIGLSDPNGNTTEYRYDAYRGDLIERISPDTGTSTSSYDAAGNLLTRTDANGQTTAYSYDSLDRVSRVAYADGQLVDYSYDSGSNGIGRLAEVSEASGVTSFEYDARGNLLVRRHTSPEGLALEVRSSYDVAGLPSQIIYPSGAVLDYAYEQERLAGMQLNGQAVLEAIEYEPTGAVTGWSWGNGLAHARTYDPNGQVQSYSLPGEVRTLDYDRLGNILAMTGAELSADYGYDALDRLIGATAAEAGAEQFDLAYSYDANGNRTSASEGGVLIPYSYQGGSNRLSAVDTQTRQYDANGNTLEDGRHSYSYDARDRLVAADTTAARYTYNDFGQRLAKNTERQYRLTADLNDDGQVTEADLHLLHTYIQSGNAPPEADLNRDGVVDGHDVPCIATGIGDSKGQGKGPDKNGPGAGKGGPHACRLGEGVTIGTHLRFLYDDEKLLGQYDTQGNPEQELLWLEGRPVAILQDGQLYFVHSDQLGAPRAVSDQNATVVWRWESRPFGDSSADEDPDDDGNAFTFNLRFPGQYFDAETGLHYNYFRDYDPATGRYTGSDPIGLEGGVNTYLYADAMPLLNVDIFGLAIYICNREVQGFPFTGNHAYVWDDRRKTSCGMNSSSSSGPTGSGNDLGPGRDSCTKVPGSDGKEDGIMNCCRKDANNGVWTPGINDCHNAANDCIKESGLTSPGAPGGRVGQRCDHNGCDEEDICGQCSPGDINCLLYGGNLCSNKNR